MRGSYLNISRINFIVKNNNLDWKIENNLILGDIFLSLDIT